MSTIDLRDLAEEWEEIEALPSIDPETEERLDALRALAEEIIGPGATREDLAHEANSGEPVLVPEDEFEEHARQLAEDLGFIDSNAQWPYTCIDWEHAARELAMDYSSVTFDGTDYLRRA